MNTFDYQFEYPSEFSTDIIAYVYILLISIYDDETLHKRISTATIIYVANFR